jgi:hypothetical protein
MIRLIKILSSALILVVILTTLVVNKSLYYKPEFVTIDSAEINQDLLKQLRFLKAQVHQGAADQMQSLYPEGHLFTNVLYGLSWCEVAEELHDQNGLYHEAMEEINFAFDALNSQEGRSTFDETLAIPYGAFYIGWNNYLLAKKLLLQDGDQLDSLQVRQFREQCEQLATAIQEEATPFPESYQHGAWPCDIVVCVASLALHDELFDPLYEEVIAQWVERAQAAKDSFGLLPHSVHADSGKALEYSRGCSQSLALNFLLDIDPVFARQQFEIYKSEFLDYRFGLPGIREYRKGETGSGDIDSGPIFLNMGGSATIVGLRTMIDFKEYEVAVAMRNTIEALTVPLEDDDGKKYLLGKLPIADLFIAWSHSKESVAKNAIIAHNDWRSTFQLYSLCVIVALILILWWMWNR